jgi:hypothetical protein
MRFLGRLEPLGQAKFFWRDGFARLKPKKTDAPKKKLRLSAETIRSLNSRDLEKVAGGGRKADGGSGSCFTECFCTNYC